MVHLNLFSRNAIEKAYDEVTAGGTHVDGVLIQKKVSGKREFVIGLHRDPQFGPCFMFGLVDIYTEVLNDAVFRVARLTRDDAEEMIDEIRSNKLLGNFRGGTEVDKNELVNARIGIGEFGIAYDSTSEIDINPLIISKGKPVATDGLVVLAA